MCVICVCVCPCSAAHSNCTNSIKSNCDVFRQMLTPVVQVGKPISLNMRFTPVDTQKKQSQRVDAREQEGSGLVKWLGHWCFFCYALDAGTNNQGTSLKAQTTM